MARTKEGRKQELQVATRDYTLNMHKRLQGIAFKKRATRAVRDIKRFATKEMHTCVSIPNIPMSCFSCACEFIPHFSFNTFFSFIIRMLELTLNWTDSSGPEVLETYQGKSESESADRRTRMRSPRRNSIAPANFLKLSLLTASKPRKDDQSNSCYSLYQW